MTSDLVRKVKLEVVCKTEESDLVVGTILTAAQMGRIGDGKNFVSDFSSAIRICAGEADIAAL